MTNPNNAVGTNGAFGGRTSVNAFNDVMGAFQNSGVLSGWVIVPSSGMTVSCGGSGTVRDVAVAEDTNGNKTSVNNISGSAIDVTLDTAPASNSRYDAIVVYVDKPPMGSGTQDNPECCGIIPVTGTAASTPSYPDDNAIRSAITADGASGATAYYAVIGYVLVASGTTTISSGMITSGPNVTIGTNRIADNAVTSGKIASSSITSGKIANNAVTNAKLDWSTIKTWEPISHTGYGETPAGDFTIPIDLSAYCIIRIVFSSEAQGGVSEVWNNIQVYNTSNAVVNVRKYITQFVDGVFSTSYIATSANAFPAIFNGHNQTSVIIELTSANSGEYPNFTTQSICTDECEERGTILYQARQLSKIVIPHPLVKAATITIIGIRR